MGLRRSRGRRNGQALAVCGCFSLWACSRTPLDDDDYPQEDATADTSVSTDGSSDAVDNDVIGDGGGDARIDALPTCAVTCSGCCTSDGTCSMPESVHLCGQNGEDCRDCGDPDAGWLCKSVCIQLGQPPCSPTTCGNGCCYGSLCSTGNLNEACGSGGQPCAKCNTSMGEHCAELPDAGGGVCTGIPECGPSTCVGCCYGEICSVGTQDFACGTAGVACSDCLVLNKGYCDMGACVSSK